jgi:hypothetical protein
MAEGRKTGGRDFQPGNTFSKGRERIPDDLKMARAFNKTEFERIANKFLYMHPNTLKEYLASQQISPEANMAEMMTASVMINCMNLGCYKRLNAILDRVIGPVPRQISGPQGGPIPFSMSLGRLTDEEAQEQIEDILEHLDRYSKRKAFIDRARRTTRGNRETKAV